MTDEAPPHQRRVRYAGTHPRSFSEKYKELDPLSHADAIDKVMARGQTPAGMHRPICVAEILAVLAPQPGEVGLDATLGYGGHARELLARLSPGGRLFGVDVDPTEFARTEARLRGLGFDASALVLHRLSFDGVAALLPAAGGGFDVILADLGVSSMQIDNPARGFSFKTEGPLDLRLNQVSGQSASELLQSVTRAALRELLTDNADDLVRQTLATALPARMPAAERKIETTKSLQRTFQALRIAVNDEFGVLERFLALLPSCLKPGGRVAILSFHSGEDRRVKKAFQAGERSGIYARVAPDALRPSAQERRDNPRSASTKLRWAVAAGPR
jgi:16S rRNA (cytosine1402-N4)-methyltransferase